MARVHTINTRQKVFTITDDTANGYILVTDGAITYANLLYAKPSTTDPASNGVYAAVLQSAFQLCYSWSSDDSQASASANLASGLANVVFILQNTNLSLNTIGYSVNTSSNLVSDSITTTLTTVSNNLVDIGTTSTGIANSQSWVANLQQLSRNDTDKNAPINNAILVNNLKTTGLLDTIKNEINNPTPLV